MLHITHPANAQVLVSSQLRLPTPPLPWSVGHKPYEGQGLRKQGLALEEVSPDQAPHCPACGSGDSSVQPSSLSLTLPFFHSPLPVPHQHRCTHTHACTHTYAHSQSCTHTHTLAVMHTHTCSCAVTHAHSPR